VLAAGAVGPAEAVYAGTGGYALWCRDDDGDTAAVLAGRGYGRAETTRPMVCRLRDPTGAPGADPTARPGADPTAGPGADPAAGPDVLVDADPGPVAALNGVPPHLLRGVPGLRAYATAGYESALILISAGTDVNVSFVATRPPARGRGLATAVLGAALADARRRGARTATLQATPMAERLYLRLGFRPVGRWQEWSPATRDPS
jgi:GNAT superfamily N-acetyltransferase